MSENLATITVTGGSPQTYRAPNYNTKAFVIGNESGFTCIITLNGGNVQKTLYPSVVDYFPVNQGFTGEIVISPVTVLNNVATFPASSIIIDAIWLGDPEEALMYPISLARNTNIGNQVTTIGGVANSVQNDNNPASTSIVEATVTGDGNSAVSITNNGHAVLGSVLNSALVEFIGTAGNFLFSTTGQVQIDNKILANLLRTITGNDLTLDAETGHKIAMQINHADVVDVDVNGVTILSGAVNFLTGSVSRASKFTGTATTTPTLFNHGLGAIPDLVIVTFNSTSSTAHSFAVDYATLTSTQAKITSDGTNPFVAWALKF